MTIKLKKIYKKTLSLDVIDIMEGILSFNVDYDITDDIKRDEE